VIKDKDEEQNVDRVLISVGNDCVDATSSEEEFDMNMVAQYQSDGEPDWTN
ncbi:hypothetical protein HN51_044566, partial [Arachis hypogaea]